MGIIDAVKLCSGVRKDMMIDCCTKIYDLGQVQQSKKRYTTDREYKSPESWTRMVKDDSSLIRSHNIIKGSWYSTLRNHHEAKITSDKTLRIETHALNALFHVSGSVTRSHYCSFIGSLEFWKEIVDSAAETNRL